MSEQSRTVCELNKCAGCMACVNVCPSGAITVNADVDACNAVIDEKLCTGCRACYRICPTNSQPVMRETIKCMQGWSADEHDRGIGASGGLAGSVAKAFIKGGGVVYGNVFKDGKFTFARIDETAKLAEISGSRYVKSDATEVYSELAKDLRSRDVLFIGLPCQVAGVVKFVEHLDAGMKRAQGKLYTADIVCHGSPSAKLLEKYFEQIGHRFEDVREIEFRRKTGMGLNELPREACADCTEFGGDDFAGQSEYYGKSSEYQIVSRKNSSGKNSSGKNSESRCMRSAAPAGMRDAYTLAFLNSLSFTENCYECRYARLERVSDITFGDAWGSKLPKSEQSKGISLVLCQTDKGCELIDAANAELKEFDLEAAVKHNQQLSHPSDKPCGRETFIESVKAGGLVENTVRRLIPKQWAKQRVRHVLTQMGVNKMRASNTIEYGIRYRCVSHVLHILVGGETGGIETLCAEYAYLSAHRNVFLILWKPGEISREMHDNGIDVVEMNASGKSTGQIVRGIEDVVKRFEIDTLVVHHASPKAHVYMQLVKMRNHKLHTVSYAHGLAGVMCRDEQKRGLAFRRMVFRWSLNKSDMIIAVSEASKKSLVEYFGCDESRIHVVHNGVNLEKFEKCDEANRERFGKLDEENLKSFEKHNKANLDGFADGDVCGQVNLVSERLRTFNVIYVGRLIEGKGVQVTLRALASIKGTVDFHFDVVGDGEYRGELERLAGELGIAEYVTFMGSRRDVPELLSRADVFVHVPTLEEGFGITIIEAMAAGLLCICSRSGAIGEIICDGVNGRLVDKGDDAALAEALREAAVMGSDDRERFRRESIRRAKDFDAQKFAERLDELIEGI